MKNKKIFHFFMFFLLFVFICSYFVEYSGYYEYSLANQRNLTEKQIQQFENDVKLGKNIDLNEYLKNQTTDYSNQLTKTTSEFNLKLNEYLKQMLQNTFKIFEKLVQ